MVSWLESSCLMANLRSTAGNQDGAATPLPLGTPTFLPSHLVLFPSHFVFVLVFVEPHSANDALGGLNPSLVTPR